MDFTVWVKKSVTIIIYSQADDKEKGRPPLITGKIANPQILVEPDKATITIIETK